MLEKKGKLETEEKNMLSISKQRTQCLGDVLDDLSQNFEKSVDKKFIIDKCYQQENKIGKIKEIYLISDVHMCTDIFLKNIITFITSKTALSRGY